MESLHESSNLMEIVREGQRTTGIFLTQKQRGQHQKQFEKNGAKPARKEVRLPWLPTMRMTTVWLKEEEDTMQKVWA